MHLQSFDLGILVTGSGRKRSLSRSEEKYKKWKSNALMIWDKIADHRNGNTFMKKIKDERFLKFVKEPMTLDTIKTKIRDGVIIFFLYNFNFFGEENEIVMLISS